MEKIDCFSSEKNNKIAVYCQNDLINLNQTFTQCQLDILFYLLHIVKDDETRYTFPAKDLSLISGKDINSAELNQLCKKLIVGSLSVVDENGNWHHYNLFQSISYKNGIVSVILSEFGVPLLKRAQNNFTQFELQSALSLSSKYSKRLYWLLSQWKTLGEKTYDITDFRRLLGVEYEDEKKKTIISLYDHFGSFKRVIESCCQEISSDTDLIVKPVWGKDSRSYSKVTFKVQVRKNVEVISFKDSPTVLALLKYARSHKFTEEEARTMISKGLTVEIFKEVIQRVVKRFEKNPDELANANAYIRECLVRDGYLPKQKVNVDNVLTKRQREQYVAMRNMTIENIKVALSYGTPKEAFIDNISKYDISDEELGIK